MSSRDTVWVRYTWDLQHLCMDVQQPAAYAFRSAQSDERDTVIELVLAAYRSDPVWGQQVEAIEGRLTERIKSSLGTQDTDYIAAECDGRLVAVSGVAKWHWTGQNLLTGTCVLPEHQRKGVGSYLLRLSLCRLREMGLVQARVYAGAGSVADRKLYPLFGSCREEGVVYPGALPSNRPHAPDQR
jgi:GNAT superfamily N-acetyltransferase